MWRAGIVIYYQRTKRFSDFSHGLVNIVDKFIQADVDYNNKGTAINSNRILSDFENF